MTEDEARKWLGEQGWWQGTQGDRLRVYVALLLEEADRQNLISTASRAELWSRHIVDCAQLMTLAPAGAGLWVDLGSGAGLPGIVIACLRGGPVRLIESRPLRAGFLRRCVEALALDQVEVVGGRVEAARFGAPAQVISARAFAPLDRLLASAQHLGDRSTLWLLPKGRSGEKELAIARAHWQAVFHVEQSLTDPESRIVTIRNLAPISPPPPPPPPAPLRKPTRHAFSARGSGRGAPRSRGKA